MGHSTKYTRILVPVDGTEETLRAVRLAGELACATQSIVDLLYVSPFDESTDEGDVPWLPRSVVRPAAEEAHEIFIGAESLLPDNILLCAITVRERRQMKSCSLLMRWGVGWWSLADANVHVCAGCFSGASHRPSWNMRIPTY